MGILAEFFVSTPDRAPAYDTAPTEFPDRAEFKGLTLLDVANLCAILEGDLSRSEALVDEFPTVFERDDFEVAIFHLVDRFTLRLAQLDEPELIKAAGQWAATEELACGTEDILPVVRTLSDLARRAQDTGHRLYYYQSV